MFLKEPRRFLSRGFSPPLKKVFDKGRSVGYSLFRSSRGPLTVPFDRGHDAPKREVPSEGCFYFRPGFGGWPWAPRA